MAVPFGTAGYTEFFKSKEYFRLLSLLYPKIRESKWISRKILRIPENLYYKAMENAIEAHEKRMPAMQKKEEMVTEEGKMQNGRGTEKTG